MKLYNQLKLKPFRRELRQNSTKAERIIWGLVRNRQILNLKFFRQYGVENYILDFYCPEIQLAIEIDGGQHNELQIQLTDNERTDDLKRLQIHVLRFWNNDVLNNTEGVYSKIIDTVKELLPTSSLEKRRSSLSFTKRGLG